MKTTTMFTLSAITLVMSIASIRLIVQGADAQDCITQKVTSCLPNFTNAIAAAGGDKNNICSEVNTYLPIDCLTKVGTDCKLDPSSVSQMIAAVKKTFSQYVCGSGNGAGSIAYHLVALMSGLTFYKLF